MDFVFSGIDGFLRELWSEAEPELWLKVEPGPELRERARLEIVEWYSRLSGVVEAFPLDKKDELSLLIEDIGC